MVREAHHVKSLFNTGVVLYLTGIAGAGPVGDDLRDRGESLVGAGRGEPAI